jgi:hypothetical protein
MKKLLLIIPILSLASCAGSHHTSPEPPLATADQLASDEALPNTDNTIREPSRLHTYIVNDYVDPNNPRLRHRGHLVDVVDQDEKWNLHSTDTTETNLGPVTAVNDPNAAPNPYSAEFETELAQQRDQFHQLVDLGAKMTAEMERLQDMAEKNADAVSDNASLRNRLDALQQEIDALKTPPPPPIPPQAPKKPSWLESIWDLFRQVPHGKPTAEIKPAFHADATLRPPEVSTTPPKAQTNAPDADPVPPPGEMAHPHNDSLPQP